MEQLNQLWGGFVALTDPMVFLYMTGGLLLGTIFSAVPGLTSTLALALVLPMTYSLDPVTSLVMCGSIYMGGMHGGSITAVAINIPGAPAAVMTALDGNVMMRRGQGAKALRVAAVSSAIGGVVGALLLMAVTPITAALALYIKTPGKFSLILFSLVVVVISHRQDLAKAVVATLLGIMIATIGIDTMAPVARATFGQPWLIDGIDIMALVIGAFAVTEMLNQAEKGNVAMVSEADMAAAKRLPRKDFWPTWSDIREIGIGNLTKSSVIGYIVGVLPGAGGNAAAFLGYAEAQRSSRRPQEFGHGSVEGIGAAECANNSNVGGSFVPTLTFGIPGDTVAAVILGVLIINGLQPGPQLMTTQFHLVAPMMAALVVSAMMIPLTLFLGGSWYLRIVAVHKGLLFSGIGVIAMMGAYVSTYSYAQMGMALAVGLGCYYLQKQRYSIVCLLLGYILGPDLEVYLRRCLSISDGDPSIFLTSPDSVFFLVLTAVFFYFMIIRPAKIMTIED